MNHKHLFVNGECHCGLTNGRLISDERAMNAIAAIMLGSEWSADTLDAIADTVRATGREIDC